MLGALIKVTKLVAKDAIIKSIFDTVSEKYRELNIKAIEKGYDLFS